VCKKTKSTGQVEQFYHLCGTTVPHRQNNGSMRPVQLFHINRQVQAAIKQKVLCNTPSLSAGAKRARFHTFIRK
jgi:hypothetical protein